MVVHCYYRQGYYIQLNVSLYLRHRFIAKTALRGVTDVTSAGGIARSMSALYTFRRPGADAQARRKDQADQ